MTIKVKPKLISSIGEINQLQHNEKAFANRSLIVGGYWRILGPIGSAVKCGQFATIRVVNTTASWHYVKTGSATVVAPTGLTDGIAIPPNGEVNIASGLDTHVIADSASVGAYVVEDNVAVVDDQQPGNP